MKSFTETTIANLFLNRVYRFGSTPFVYSKVQNEWKSRTWHEIGASVEILGRSLLALGYGKGDHIAIMSENRAEWMICDLAILSIGAVSVPIYAGTEPEQAAKVIAHSDSKAIFLSNPELCKKLRGFPDLKIKHWFCFEENVDSAMGIQSLTESTKVDAFTYYQNLASIEGSDLATIVYTSGTTGEPKGVCLTHANLIANILASTRAFPVRSSDISLSFLPLSHVFERTCGFFCLIYFGAKIYIAESLQKVPENLVEIKPTILISVPRVLEKFYNRVHQEIERKPFLLKNILSSALETDRGLLHAVYSKLFFGKIRAKLGGKLRFIITGGAALSPRIAEFVQRIGIPVIQGYGLTETSPIISFNRIHNNRIGSVGELLDNVELKLSEEGEILVRGPSIMRGYYKNDTATREVMTEDNYFKTGDIGKFEEGFLWITDRKKDLIVTSGGKKIAPLPIENELVNHPMIDQVCLVGDGMKTIAALVVPNEEYVMNLASQKQLVGNYAQVLQSGYVRNLFQEIVNDVNRHLSQFQQIKNFTLLTRPFTHENGEITATLKLRRKVIHDRYKTEIEELFREFDSKEPLHYSTRS